MRFRQVREILIDTVRDTIVDKRARGSDVLAVHRDSKMPESVTSRTFMPRLTKAPVKSGDDSCDLFDVSFDVVIMYPAGTDTEARVGDDTEALYTPLWRMHAQHADLQNTTVGDASSAENMGMVTLTIPVAVQYRLDSTLI